MSGAANSVVVPFRLSSCVLVAGRPGFIGSPFRVRPSAWICVFSLIDKTTAWSGGSMYSAMTSWVFSANFGSVEDCYLLSENSPKAPK